MSRRPDTAPHALRPPRKPLSSTPAPESAPRDSGPARNTPPQSRLLRALRRDAQKAALHELQGQSAFFSVRLEALQYGFADAQSAVSLPELNLRLAQSVKIGASAQQQMMPLRQFDADSFIRRAVFAVIGFQSAQSIGFQMNDQGFEFVGGQPMSMGCARTTVAPLSASSETASSGVMSSRGT